MVQRSGKLVLSPRGQDCRQTRRLLTLVSSEAGDSASNAGPTAVSQPRGDDVPVQGTTTPNETILVIEDDPLLLEFVFDFLSYIGYKVLTASNRDGALRYLEDETLAIDLVFSDIRIPGGMSGVALARKTRALRPELKIMLTTGFAKEFMEEPVDEEFPVLQKPYLPNELAQAIRALLDSPSV